MWSDDSVSADFHSNSTFVWTFLIMLSLDALLIFAFFSRLAEFKAHEMQIEHFIKTNVCASVQIDADEQIQRKWFFLHTKQNHQMQSYSSFLLKSASFLIQPNQISFDIRE